MLRLQGLVEMDTEATGLRFSLTPTEASGLVPSVQPGREELCCAFLCGYFSPSFCFRRLNDPSVVTPFSRDDRGQTPLHVAALCGMWPWAGFCEGKRMVPHRLVETQVMGY